MDEETRDVLYKILDAVQDMEEDVSLMRERVYELEKNLSMGNILNAFNEFHDRLRSLGEREKDYLINQQKCNAMINELKGVVSISRGALAERKEADIAKKVAEKENIDSIRSAIDAFMNYQNKQYAYFTVKIRDINKTLKSIENSLNNS